MNIKKICVCFIYKCDVKSDSGGKDDSSESFQDAY